MCGLFGVVAVDCKLNYELALKSLHKVTHRGPDQWGEYKDSNIFIGHRRLSIMDVTLSGRQPMKDAQDTTVIAVNGEIYNYKKLKKELESDYEFSSGSDSEVILHGYDKWGLNELLSKLEGMYAFVIYDRKSNFIHLARDRLGIKPIYFAWNGKEFLWSSELKSIECYWTNLLEPNYEAAYDFLTYRYIPSPKSIWKNVYKLEAGNLLSFSLTKRTFNIKRYWQLSVGDNESSVCAEEIAAELDSAVKSHLMSDIGVSFFLSGGLDSSLLTCLASKYLPELKTYNIGFENPAFDETKYALKVSSLINSNHIVRMINEKEASELYLNLKEWFDEPFADFSAIPTYLLCKIVREDGNKVVIGGDGGDEIFAGYKWYFHKNIEHKPNLMQSLIYGNASKLLSHTKYYSRIWRLGRLCARKGHYYGLELHSNLIGALPRERKLIYKQKYSIPSDYDDHWFFRKYYRADLPIITRMQYLDIHTYLPEDILTKLDRVSMATSVEARVPYLSHSLLELIFSYSDRLRNLNRTAKHLQKNIAEKFLPQDIINRQKKGFGLPKEYRTSQKDGTFIYEQEKVLNELFPKIS